MILDTNALSALAEKQSRILERLEGARRLAVTLITLGEFSFGILGSRRKNELERWLAAFLERAEVLSPDFGTLPHYARLRAELKAAGTPIPANDCWISALALQHRMPLLSRDRHFDCVSGVRRIDW